MLENKKKDLLVVEDDLSILEALIELLTEEGFSVSTARNGEEALALLKQYNPLPDLIILDLMMPVLDGVSFRKLQKLDPLLETIPVILMSADSHFQQKGSQTNFSECIKKPIDLEAFMKLIRKHSHQVTEH